MKAVLSESDLKKSPPHKRMIDQVNFLDQEIARLENLINEILDPEKIGGMPDPEVTVDIGIKKVLELAPDLLLEKRKRINVLIDRLYELLFDR